MSEMTHTPADVRERVAREVYTLNADWRREYWDQFRRDFPRQAQAYYDIADRILALLRTSRSEGEAREEPVYMTCMGCGQEFDPDDDTQSRYHEAACEVVDYEPARVEIARRLRDAALRSDAEGEDRWEDLVFGPIVQAYNEAHAARRGEGGSNGLE